MNLHERFTRVRRWADGFVIRRHGRPKDEETLRRLVVIYMSTLVLLVFSLLWATSFFSYGWPLLGWYAVFSCVVPLVLLALIRDVRWIEPWSHLMLGTLLAALVVANFSTGGLAGANDTVFLTVPLVAILVLGRAGLVWGAITLVAVVGFLVLNSLGYPFPQALPDKERNLDMALTYLSSFFVILGVVYAYERARRKAADHLEAARRQAEEASRSKGQFLANMSHEIRTPLNAVIGLTEVVLQEKLTGEIRDELLLVKESAESLHSILNDILDFSKIEAGKITLERIEFDLRPLVEGLLKTHAVRADQRGLEIVCRVAPGVPERLVGDPGRLRQVLNNLVANALKFTERGEVELSVEPMDREASSARLRFSVRDTGIGIPKERQGAIFEAFTQADGSTTRRFGGTGLGLSISVRLAELLGGRLEVESEVGSGSTFRFAALFGVAEPLTATSPGPDPDLAGKRALVLDDNASSRHALAEMLGELGLAVTEICDASEAEMAVRRASERGEDLDVGFVDASSPPANPAERLECLKSQPSWKGALVLMMGASRSHRDTAEERRLGVDAVVSKPVGKAELQAALREAMGRKGEPRRTSQVAPERWGGTRRKLKLLVAEDNPINARVVASLLGKRGHDVAVVENGRAAVQAIERDRYDSVLMDVQMPDMDGFEATRAIRAAEKARGGHVRILALTAHAQSSDRDRCREAGMDGYVSKPIRPAELFAALEGDGLPSAAEAAAPEPEPEVGLAVLDLEALRSRVGDDPELTRELLESFRSYGTRLAHEMQEAREKADSHALNRAAHSMKGSAANIGALALAAAASRLEELAGKQDLAGAETAEQEVARELERVLSEMTRVLEEG